MFQYQRRGSILSLEALCYLAVLLVLVGIGVFGWKEHTDNARRSTARADCVTIASAVSQYNYETRAMPTNLTKLTQKGGTGNELGPWLTELKNDPWGKTYKLYVDKTNKKFVIYSDVNGTAKGSPQASDDALARGGFVGVVQHFEYQN